MDLGFLPTGHMLQTTGGHYHNDGGATGYATTVLQCCPHATRNEAEESENGGALAMIERQDASRCRRMGASLAALRDLRTHKPKLAN